MASQRRVQFSEASPETRGLASEKADERGPDPQDSDFLSLLAGPGCPICCVMREGSGAGSRNSARTAPRILRVSEPCGPPGAFAPITLPRC